MSTRDVIDRYFDRLASGGDWQSLLADDAVFTSYTSPTKEATGKTASDVAEIFSVRNGRITSLGIYFDTAPYPK